jgi:signal transduction histidine kinase
LIARVTYSHSGVGFDPDGKKGICLSNIYERAEAINAKVSLKSYPGDGTEIQVLWQREQKN